mmetsp:Transcript_39258/g.103506  ORF Transcript_39258/g.103506 Transcript_39258/m.103506 type:complete len:311 (-) Transcript_39258:305-1237(-)
MVSCGVMMLQVLLLLALSGGARAEAVLRPKADVEGRNIASTLSAQYVAGDVEESPICQALDGLLNALNDALTSLGTTATCEALGANTAKIATKIVIRTGPSEEVQFGFYMDVMPCDAPPAFTLGVNTAGKPDEDVATVKFGDAIILPIPGLAVGDSGFFLLANLEGDIHNTHLKVGIKIASTSRAYTVWLTGEDGIDFGVEYECPGCMMVYESITDQAHGAIPFDASCPVVFALLSAPLVLLCCLCCCLCAVCRQRKRHAASLRMQQHLALLNGPDLAVYHQQAAYRNGQPAVAITGQPSMQHQQDLMVQ